MSEEEVVGDNGSATAEDGISSSSPVTETEHKLIMGKFKSEDEAAKAYKELEHKLGQQGNELGNLRKEVEDAGEKKQFLSALQAVVDNTKPKQHQVTAEEFEAELVEALRDDPAKGAKKLLSTQASWMADLENRSKAEIQKLKDEFTSELRSLKSDVVKSDPDYLDNKAVIDEMVANGMAFENAKIVAKKYLPKSEASRQQPPVGMSSQRTIASEPVAVISKEEREQWKREGLSEDEIALQEAKYKLRQKADRMRPETWR